VIIDHINFLTRHITLGAVHICFDIFLGLVTTITRLHHLHYIGVLAQILFAFTKRAHAYWRVLLETMTLYHSHFRRAHIPFLGTSFEDGLVYSGGDGEPGESVPPCQHTDVAHNGSRTSRYARH